MSFRPSAATARVRVRAVSLYQRPVKLGIEVPVILDESDHHADVFERVDSFDSAPESESLGFAQAHPSLYAVSQGRVRLAVQGGQLNLSSLLGPGFGRAASPLWSHLSPIN